MVKFNFNVQVCEGDEGMKSDPHFQDAEVPSSPKISPSWPFAGTPSPDIQPLATTNLFL